MYYRNIWQQVIFVILHLQLFCPILALPQIVAFLFENIEKEFAMLKIHSLMMGMRGLK